MTIRSHGLAFLLALVVGPTAAAELTEDMLRQLDLLEEYGQGYRIQDVGDWRLLTNSTVDEAKQLLATVDRAQSTWDAVMAHLGVRLEPPADRLLIVLHRDRQAFDDYFERTGAFKPSENLGGFYSPLSNRVECYAGAEDAALRISHEVSHQLAFNQGVLRRRELLPMWLVEGLAGQFEMGDPTAPYGPLTDNQSNRRGELVLFYRKGWLAPLEDLFSWSKAEVERLADLERRRPAESRRAANESEAGDVQIARLALVYVQGFGVCRFLIREKPRQFREFLRLLSVPNQPREPDARLIQAERVFGPLDDLQTEWEAWLAVELANDPDPPEDDEEPDTESEEAAE